MRQIDRQITHTIVMVSPDQFGFNPQTAVTNVFQHSPEKEGLAEQKVRDSALHEFHEMVHALASHDIQVLVLPSRKDVVTPDAIFPNNWFSHHSDNTLVFYPMLTPNRRAERQEKQLQNLLTTFHLSPHIFDFSQEENRGNILEGTGSMVLDRIHKVSFAIESSRTTQGLFFTWCKKMHYEPFLFHAFSDVNIPLYHTNMFMSIGDSFAIYCPESIPDAQEKALLERKLQDLHKELIAITLKQVYGFCGNILQIISKKGKKKIVLSTTAMKSFTTKQKKILEKYGDLLPVDIPTIEKIGGGSARCMMAEIF